jgi:hypothetical protein
MGDSFIISNSRTGRYAIRLIITGPSASEYILSSEWNVTVLGDNDYPTPAISSAKLSDSGSSIVITFDTDTNRANIVDLNFPCALIFFFKGVQSTYCNWISSAIVKADFNPSNISDSLFPMPGDEVGLKACNLTSVLCSGSSACPQIKVVEGIRVLPPDHLIRPTVLLNVPGSLSTCDSLSVDASMSTGAGGRRWLSVKWDAVMFDVDRNEPATTMLEILKRSGDDISKAITIPVLRAAKYVLSLTVINQFGQSNSQSVYFEVVDQSSSLLPTFSILSPPIVVMTPRDALRLYASITRSGCAKNNIVHDYAWRVLNSTYDPVVISDRSGDKTSFALDPFSLLPQTIYTVEFKVTSSESPLQRMSYTQSVTIHVRDGDVVIVITGGYNRFIQRTDALIIDASSSYDENNPSAAAASSDSFLSCQWSCEYIDYESYGQACDSLVFHHPYVETNSTILQIPPDTLNTTHQYQFTIVCQSIALFGAGRSATSSVNVAVGSDVGASSTTTSITTTLTSISYSNQLVLNGLVGAVKSSYGLDCEWTMQSDGLPVDFFSSISMRTSFSRGELSAGSLVVSLVVPSYTFTPGSTVTFRLTAFQSIPPSSSPSSTSYQSFVSYSEVSIVVRDVPRGGLTSIDPKEGEALKTSFSISTYGWTVDSSSSYPLSYEFTYQLVYFSPRIFIQAMSAANRVITEFSSGLASSDYQLIVVSKVFDVFLSAANRTLSVKVVPFRGLGLGQSSVADLTAYFQQKADVSKSLSGSSTVLINAISNIASALNNNNCSLASNSYCESLNRQPCFETSNTCSSCKEGYRGIVGDSNKKCVVIIDADAGASTTSRRLDNIISVAAVASAVVPVQKLALGPCSSDDDCIYGQCIEDTGTCAVQSLACPSMTGTSECSGHGICKYVDQRGVPTEGGCSIFDTHCFAECKCFTGYGGLACSWLTQEVQERSQLRTALCDAINEVGQQFYFTSSTMTTFLTLLTATFDLTDTPPSSSGWRTCQEALTLAFDQLKVKSILSAIYSDTIQTMLDVTSRFVIPSSGEGGSTSSGSYVDNCMTQLSAAAFQVMVPGQRSIYAFTSDNLRISFLKEQKQLSGRQLVLQPPLTAKELAYGHSTASFIQFSSQEAISQYSSSSSSSGYIQLSAMLWGRSPFPNATHMAGQLLRVQSLPPSGATDQSSSTSSSSSSSSTAYYIVIQFERKQSFDRSVSIATAVSTYRENFTFPECMQYDVEGGGGSQISSCSGCSVSSYTDYNVTFACNSSNQRLLSSQRGLISQLPSDLPFSSLSSSSPSSFAATHFTAAIRGIESMLTSNPFSVDIQRAKAVVALLLALLVAMIVGSLGLHRWDRIDRIAAVYAKKTGNGDLVYDDGGSGGGGRVVKQSDGKSGSADDDAVSGYSSVVAAASSKAIAEFLDNLPDMPNGSSNSLNNSQQQQQSWAVLFLHKLWR